MRPTACAAALLALAQVNAAATAANNATFFLLRQVRGMLEIETAPTPFDPSTPDAIVWGYYNDTLTANGWTFIDLHATPSTAFTDADKAYAAGFAEGYVTSQRSWEYITNNFAVDYAGSGIGAFIEEQIDWVKSQVAAYPSDPYWHQVGLVFTQQTGLYNGYSQAAGEGQDMDFLSFFSSTLSGDLDDLCTKFNTPKGVVTLADGTPTTPTLGKGHCSLLVKPLGTDLSAPSDIIIGHTTWSGFESMTRVYKHYDLPFTLTGAPGSATVPGRHISLSSYPSCLSSDDDYYVIEPSGLVVSETTINNHNSTLWDLVQPRGQVLEWARNLVANRLAVDGPSWAETFSRANSGTYNNMWHVLDMKLFTPGKPLPDNTLWVLQQMPGHIVAADHTGFLRGDNATYWASYNRIADPGLFELTNQTALLDTYGDHFSYNLTARAVIFRREQAGVVDEESFKALLRYNHFQTDPVGTQGCKHGRSGSNAISERGDLTPQNAGCIGDISFQDEAGIDGKFTTWSRRTAGVAGGYISSVIQSGPTFDTQPPFSWSNTSIVAPHVGQPDTYAFPWMEAVFYV